MSDISDRPVLLAAVPLLPGWGESTRLPLAVLPCVGGFDLTSRTAFRKDE